MSQVQGFISVAPQIPLLVSAGAGHRSVISKGFNDDDVAPEAVSDSKLDISIWFPPKQKQYKVIELKTAQERPTEGIITSFEPNKHFQHKQIVEVERRKVNTYKFCNRGDSGKDNTAVTDFAQRSERRGDVNDDDTEGRGADVWCRPIRHARERITNMVQRFPNKKRGVAQGTGGS